jgi:hypothetical protein
MAAMPELVFVLPQHANIFWTEIAEAACAELEAIGVSARTTTEGFPPPRRGLVYVLTPPHEYFALDVALRGNPPPPPEVLRRTIFICGEQPGTSHFDENVALAPQGGAVFDINRGSIREFVRRGVTALPFQLGYTERWDHRSEQEQRDVDVLFMGSLTPRRERWLAESAATLWRWHCRFVFSDNSRPNFAPSARFLADEEKWRALTGSKVILNVHQGGVPYFEWARVVQTIANGCALVTEHSTDFAPLEPGEHFLPAALENVALVAETLLEDDDRRRRLEQSAYDFVRRELPLRCAVEELASVAEDVDRHPVVVRASGLLRRWRPLALPPQGESVDDRLEVASLRRAVSGVLAEVRAVERALERATGENGPSVEIAVTSHAYGTRSPRVWVLTVWSDANDSVEATLDSVALGRYRDAGLIVVDDSTDGSDERVRGWVERHGALPLVALRHRLRRGTARSTNAALAFADGEFTSILPAGSSLFPHGLGRLVAALDWDQGADFAYGLVRREAIGGAALASVYPWEPARLRSGRYIHEIALVRTAVLRVVGGYATDPRLEGWQAHDLWCGLAEHGGRGVFVPEIVARSPAGRTSPAELSPAAATEALRERHPTLMAGVGGAL